ncbi:PKD domain-containing protein [Ferruginibacter yonginensis]|uniref:PKD domain-containing protein n=1 Tax=Ferruginibacter yonginensis TaxID=1310416 RepID=A0ABV8QU18_9BACT
MKKQLFTLSSLAIAVVLLLVQCKKSDLELSGSASTAGFTFLQTPASDTLPYPYTVRFTNTSSEEFLYQWNFGDNTPLSAEKSPTHQFRIGGAYNVTLTTVGTNGNNSITKVVGVTDACSNDFFSKLTNCSLGEWTWSSDGDAIKVLSPDATQVYFAGGAANCQADDIFKFNADGTFGYEANGQTFDVQSGYSCQAPKPNAPSYKVVVKPNQLPKIILAPLATGNGRPFIGTTDIVENNTYTVQNYTPTTLTLRAVLENNGGVLVEFKFRKVTVLTLADIKNLLTGGGSKTWKLDPTPGANAIIVGTEANPAQYFGGGPLDGNCQSDDTYTFTAADKITYNSNGSTFNGGNVAPNYSCGSDRSYSNISYTFGATTGGVAGLATLQLPNTPPTVFIGTTDVPNENVYRIIEISANKMVLRAGNGAGTVFQFKLIPQ